MEEALDLLHKKTFTKLSNMYIFNTPCFVCFVDPSNCHTSTKTKNSEPKKKKKIKFTPIAAFRHWKEKAFGTKS